MFLPVLFPIIGAVASAFGLTLNKSLFVNFPKLDAREFTWLIFCAITLVLIGLMPLFADFPTLDQVQPKLILLFGMVVIATVNNLMLSWGLEHERVSEVQPLLLFSPIVGILIASIFYADERSWPVYIAAVIASSVLAWSHLKKHHFKLSRGVLAILGYILLYGVESVIVKDLLEIYSPLTLYFVRCALVLTTLTIVARPNFRLMKFEHLPYILLTAIFGVVSMWATYAGFETRGLSGTLFVFVLSPLLVYWLSVIFLEEKIKIKSIVTSLIIGFLVIWVSSIK